MNIEHPGRFGITQDKLSQLGSTNGFSFVVDDISKVNQFITQVLPNELQSGGALGNWVKSAGHTGGAGGIPLNTIDQIVTKVGGRLIETPSALRKEERVYGNQRHVLIQDLLYLERRDETTEMFVNKVPEEVWYSLPRTGDPEIDAWFAKLVRRGYLDAAKSAHALGRRDGSAFVEMIDGGDRSRPIQAGFDPVAFDWFEHLEIVEVDDSAPKTPLTPHGIASITVNKTVDGNDGMQTEKVTIHGSRLQLFKPSVKEKEWWGKSIILSRFDTLWQLMDVVHAQTHQQMESNPIQVKIIPEALDPNARIDIGTEDKKQLRRDLQGLVTGTRQFVNPVEGVSVERIGAADLPDPGEIINTLAAKLSHNLEFTKNQIISRSTGESDITEEDMDNWAKEIDGVRTSFALPKLEHLLNVGKLSMEVSANKELPWQLSWPEVRTYNLREKGYIYRTMAMAMDTALDRGRGLPHEINEFFPDDPTREDIRLMVAQARSQPNQGGEEAQMSDSKRLDRLEMLLEEVSMKLDAANSQDQVRVRR